MNGGASARPVVNPDDDHTPALPLLHAIATQAARHGDRPAAEELAKSFRSRFPGSPRAERLDKWLERSGD